MREVNRSGRQTYRLILRDDGLGVERTIEFEAAGAEAAFYVAQRECRGREAELMEGGRSLGRLQCLKQGGFWRLSPPTAQSGQGPSQG